MKIVEKNRVRGSQYTLTIEGDERFEVTVDAATFDDSWYHVDGNIEEEQLEDLLSRSRYNRVRSRALYYLSGRDYAAKELERKLSRSFDREVCRAVVERFVEVGLINDATYAERMARNLTEYKQYPRRRVIQALQEKGVSRAVAQAALDALEPDDFQQALALIQKRYYNKLGTKENRAKTVAALARYGFSYDAVRRAIEAASEQEISEEWD